MTPDEFNAAQLASGALTVAHVTEMVRAWQTAHGLVVDGKAGPITIASIVPEPFVLHSPLPVLADGRKPAVTSEFRPADRPNHNGVDLFYRWVAGDQPSFVGDHGCAGKNADGTPRWVVPTGTLAIAAAPGVVRDAGNSLTGFRCWIDHQNGLRSGYFHLLDLRVINGQSVTTGTALGLVGDNPVDHDGRHLHFELSPVDRYDPMDPAPFIRI